MAISLAKAAYRHFMSTPVPASLIEQGLLGSDPEGKAYPQGWVFTSRGSNMLPHRSVEGSGRCAIVFGSYDYWSPSTKDHTMRYPRPRVSVYADVFRDLDLNAPVVRDADDRCQFIYEKILGVFHDPANRIDAFDSLRIISSHEGSSLILYDLSTEDGAVRGDATFDIVLG